MTSLGRPCVILLALTTLLTGVVYPLLVTAAGGALFPAAAGGSLVERDGKVVGSRLVGQEFTDPRYFWSRPSATAPAYNASASTGSNLGPTNPAQLEAVPTRVAAWRGASGDASRQVPVELVTASGSGLDPHLSPAAADYQAPRVAAARGLAAEDVRRLVQEHTASRWLGLIGEPTVNVLELNLALDALGQGAEPH